HADALHFDLWHKGRNVLRDGGSYSYNCSEPWRSYFPGTQSHNTIEFDGRDQMPRIGRFLFGAWTKGETNEPLSQCDGSLSWSGAYTDYAGCRHQRTIRVQGDCWHVTDVISGFKKKAVLRWRLEPGQWTLEDNVCRGKDVSIEIDSDVAALELSLTDGWESRYYMEKSRLPVLEVLIKDNPAEIQTVIRLSES
ncbi:MAG: heparinase II/III-family protein, partial [Deltaproteobacteria bacterium]|nr:heparinase II/III-family protein [Deltaproteobacteria bacterium]